MDRFALLPPELFASIIDKISSQDIDTLYKCILINKQFYRAIMPSLRYSLVFYKKIIPAPVFGRRRPFTDRTNTQNIRNIMLLEDSQWSDVEFLTLVNHASRLEECVIPFTTRISKGCIQQLPFLCPNLTSLHLGNPFEGLKCLSCMASERTRFTSPLRYHKMELDLDGSHLLDDLVLYPSLLKKLSIVHPPPRLMATMTAHPQVSLESLAQFNQLTHLKLYFLPTPLFQCVFTCTSTLWPNLIDLGLAGKFTSETTLVPFLRSHPGLGALSFIHCELYDKTIATMTDVRHPGLSELSVKENGLRPGVFPSTFLRLIEMTPRLTYVRSEDRIIQPRNPDDAPRTTTREIG